MQRDKQTHRQTNTLTHRYTHRNADTQVDTQKCRHNGPYNHTYIRTYINTYFKYIQIRTDKCYPLPKSELNLKWKEFVLELKSTNMDTATTTTARLCRSRKFPGNSPLCPMTPTSCPGHPAAAPVSHTYTSSHSKKEMNRKLNRNHHRIQTYAAANPMTHVNQKSQLGRNPLTLNSQSELSNACAIHRFFSQSKFLQWTRSQSETSNDLGVCAPRAVAIQADLALEITFRLRGCVRACLYVSLSLSVCVCVCVCVRAYACRAYVCVCVRARLAVVVCVVYMSVCIYVCVCMHVWNEV